MPVVKEKIVNLFLFITGDTITEIGATWHDQDGNDDEKMKFLQRNVETDWRKSKRHPLPNWCVLKMPVFLRRKMVDMTRIARLARRRQYANRLLDAIMRPVPEISDDDG
jgi:hypothetical protein